MLRRLARAAVTLTLTVHAPLVAAAQDATPPATARDAPARRAHEYELTVTGCLRGKRLDRALVVSAPEQLPGDGLNAAQYALEGPKELIREIEKHRNHRDQVVGVATVPPSTFLGGSGPTRRLGPFSVGIGGRPDQIAATERQIIIKLKVSSFVHINETCPR